MKRKLFAILLVFILAVTMVACGEGEETTLTGMVVSVDGTVISLMEMDSSNMGNRDFAEGERPTMPEGMEGFGSFDPENFDGQMPEGMEGFEGFEGFGSFDPENFDGQMPEGMTPPEDMTLPEGVTMPESGEMPDFGGMGGMDFDNFASDAETKNVDIAGAHISVEIDGGKATGSMDDIKAGVFVTITMNGKGEVTNVLVSSQSGFGGNRSAN